jgi:glycosidase
LITADRFANGDPENDSTPNLKEKVNRNNKDGRHGGDIQGIIDHLDYIEEMGFTQIWLNPMLENNHPKYSYHGYSTTDYYQIDARFGGNSLYISLSEEAHKRGIGIIKDIVLNHCGSEHWWMKDLPSKDWINNEGNYRQTSHNRVSLHDIHTTNSETSNFVDGWFVPTMPDLNHKNVFMATYLIQNSIWWIEYANLSGFRIDTYPYHDKTFISDFGKRLIDEYPNFNFVGEEWSLNPAIVSYWQKDSPRYDNYISHTPSMMDFPLNSALAISLQEKESWNSGLIKIYETLSNDFLYGNPYSLVVFADNHDMERIYTQLNEQLSLYKMAMTYIYTTRGIPQVYYGTEILLKGPPDHGTLRTDFPGGWDSDKINGFNGFGLTNEQMEAQRFTKQLLHWRKNNLAITKGTLTHYLPQNGVYVYFRKYKKELVMVLINNNISDASVSSKRFYEILDDKTQGISVLKKQVYDLSNNIHVPGKTALVLDLQ